MNFMHETKTVSIHQPNFFPWLGFFDKLIKSDVFLLMDTAQIPQKKPSWTNRVKIIIEKQENWCPTLELVRSHLGLIPIMDAKIVENSNCRQKIARTIYFNYKKAKYFDSIFSFIEPLILNNESSISTYNYQSLLALVEKLGIDKTKLILTSELGFTMSKENLSLLITKMVKSVSGTTYLSGTASRDYMEEDIFSSAGIKLIYQEYNHPTYAQFSSREFIPGLSIIDALMNLDFEGVKLLLHTDLNTR
jgi:hypothetical protein